MRPGAVLGLLLVLAWLGVAVAAPWLAPYPEGAHDILNPLALASPLHRLGTTEDGTDVFSALIHGARVAALVGLGTVVLSVALGTIVGLWSGYRGGWADFVVVRISEIFLAFPGLRVRRTNGSGDEPRAGAEVFRCQRGREQRRHGAQTGAFRVRLASPEVRLTSVLGRVGARPVSLAPSWFEFGSRG